MSNGSSPALNSCQLADLIMKIYGEVREYDVHYSTMRSVLTTFITGVGLYAAAVIFGKVLEDPAKAPAVSVTLSLMPLLLLGLMVWISATFQQLTKACGLVEEGLENELRELLAKGAQYSPNADALCVRQAVDRWKNTEKAKFTLVFSDGAQKVAFGMTLLYSLALLYYHWFLAR